MRRCLTTLCARRGAREQFAHATLAACGVHVGYGETQNYMCHGSGWLRSAQVSVRTTPVQLSFCSQVSAWNFLLVRSTLSRQDYTARWKRHRYGPTGASRSRHPEKYLTLTQCVCVCVCVCSVAEVQLHLCRRGDACSSTAAFSGCSSGGVTS